MAMTKRDDNREAHIGERVRATPLRPVVWMTSVLVWAAAVALILRVPTWASVFLCTMTGVSFLLFLVSYVYLFVNDREALRAERWRKTSGGPTSREMKRSEREALGEEDLRGYLGSERAEVLVARSSEGADKVRVDNADYRTTK